MGVAGPIGVGVCVRWCADFAACGVSATLVIGDRALRPEPSAAFLDRLRLRCCLLALRVRPRSPLRAGGALPRRERRVGQGLDGGSRSRADWFRQLFYWSDC